VLPLRVIAAALAVLGTVPLWRVLADRPTGLAGAATAQQAAAHSAVLWSGFVLCAVPGILAAVLIDREAFEALLERMVTPLRRPRTIVFAATVAISAFIVAACIAQLVLGGVPTLIDSFAQLLHARYLAEGTLAGPVTPQSEFWHIQQTLLTRNGWVSQYPPGHVALLAFGMKVGAAWIIGPLCWGIAVLFTTLALHRLVSSLVVARLASLLAALSPFGLALSGAFMSHVPAAACAAIALYGVIRAREGRLGFALLAGAAIGMLFTMRPLTAVALGIVALAAAFIHKRPLSAVLAVIAASPFAAAVAWYNHHFFGSALRFGYTAALGENAGLGFGIDPWGNQYGIVEALAYTAAELGALSLYLFETPLPWVAIVGLYFTLSKPTANEWLLFAWCAAPVVANLFYWHHGLFMGPRMLADVGIMWGALAPISVIGLVRGIRADWRIADKYSPRTFATGMVTAALVFGMVMLVPQRLGSYRPTAEVRGLLTAPDIDEPALVFVHGGWSSRVAMKLAGNGMRLDSVETAMRQNPTCTVHQFADSFARGTKSSIRLDFMPRATNLPAVAEIAPGNRIRVAANQPIDAVCNTEIRADLAGIIDVTPFIWQGDLPGQEPAGALFVRDLGPEENRKLIAAHNMRRPLMMLPDGDSVRLVPYSIAERAFWEAAP
jgi:hypothetical protein